MVFEVQDYYFKQAKKDNYLARSAYKLEEINQRFHLIKKNQKVLDLGYFPGSWAQYTSNIIGPGGLVVGIDLKPLSDYLLEHYQNIKIFQHDIYELPPIQSLLGLDASTDIKFDCVLSDMAPNTCGIKSVDQIRSLDLVENVWGLLPKYLKHGGNFVIKIFESQDAQNFLKKEGKCFEEKHFLRPKSTRGTSKEYFFVGKCFISR
jgi:23S rRNA (uridine2552-2'-O)-methyltransferase